MKGVRFINPLFVATAVYFATAGIRIVMLVDALDECEVAFLYCLHVRDSFV